MTKVDMSILILMSLIGLFGLQEANAAKYTAMYIFGDSLIDAGTNNDLLTLAKSNFYPYGIDFSRGPTGRFSNGKVLVDFIAELLGLPLVPSYSDVTDRGASILSGVNFASAGAGILKDTGYRFGQVIPLSGQVSNLNKTVGQLKMKMQDKEVSEYLARALALLDMGANDYLNNYIQSKYYGSSHIYNPNQFADLLINRYKQYILEIQGIGVRKFFITEASPFGCTPMRSMNGKCEASSNNLIKMFNTRLNTMVRELQRDYPRSVFMFAAATQVFFRVFDNAEAYGFKVRDTACCGDSNKGGYVPLCFPSSIACSNRDEHFFWDAAHPTEAVDRILAHLIYNATSWK